MFVHFSKNVNLLLAGGLRVTPKIGSRQIFAGKPDVEGNTRYNAKEQCRDKNARPTVTVTVGV
jgi:hypothetical protein